MAMTDQEHKALRSYCAFLLKEFGFQFSPNDPVIPALYIFHKEVQRNSQHNKALASLVQDASSKMHSKVFNFNAPGEAWKFQLAIASKWIAIGLLVLILLWGIAWYWAIKKDIESARTIINTSENMTHLIKRVSKDSEGFYFIDFTQAKGKTIKSYTEFEQLTEGSVRVYLGKEPK